MTLRPSASILLLTVLLGRAQSTAKTEPAAISPATIRALLEERGFQFTEKSSRDSTAFAFPLNGHSVRLLSQAKSIQLSACFEDHVADPMKENQWNREHFSTGAYLDEQGCASLRASAKFGGRVTNEMIEEFIGEFVTGVTIYARFVTDLPPASNEPSSSLAGRADRPTSPIGPMEWSQSGQTTRSAPPWRDAAKFVPGLLKINHNISLSYDPDRWTLTAPDSDGHLTLTHSSGDAHVLVISERVAVPRGSVEDIALANAQSVDPKAKIVFRQQRRGNGVDVRFLKVEAEVNAVPMVYWGCFYGGQYGTVQVVAYTMKIRLPEYEKDFMDLLNGFMVSK